MWVGCRAAVGVWVWVCQRSAFLKWIILNHCRILCCVQLVIVVTQAYTGKREGQTEEKKHNIESEMNSAITSLPLLKHCKHSCLETEYANYLSRIRAVSVQSSQQIPETMGIILDYQEHCHCLSLSKDVPTQPKSDYSIWSNYRYGFNSAVVSNLLCRTTDSITHLL